MVKVRERREVRETDVEAAICQPGERQSDYRVTGREYLMVRAFSTGERHWMLDYMARKLPDGRRPHRAKFLGVAGAGDGQVGFATIKPIWTSYLSAIAIGRDPIGEEKATATTAKARAEAVDARLTLLFGAKVWPGPTAANSC